jgi:hypothetical protein
MVIYYVYVKFFEAEYTYILSVAIQTEVVPLVGNQKPYSTVGKPCVQVFSRGRNYDELISCLD